MKLSALFPSACLIVLSMSLKAQTDFQPGYYITYQSDTVFGEIDKRSDMRNCRICTFRLAVGGEIISIEPGDISAYRFSGGGKYYISKEVNIQDTAQTVFLEYLVNGISNLYYYRGQGMERYFIESEDGRITELSNDIFKFNVDGVDYKRTTNLYVGQMRASFEDCPEIQSKLDKARFSHKSLMQLTSEYHDYVCDGEECIIYEKNLPVIQVSGGPYMGMVRSSLDFPSYEGSDTDFAFDASYKWYHYYDFSTENDLILGLRLRFTLPRFNEKLALLVLTEYSQSDFYAYTEDQTNPGLLTQMEAHAHLSSLNLMTGFQYTYSKGTLKPSLTIGPVFNIDLNSYFDIEHTMIADTLEIVQDHNTNPIGGMTMGGFAQLGFDWAFSGAHHLGFNLRYHLIRQRTTHYINRDGIALSLYYNFTFN